MTRRGAVIVAVAVSVAAVVIVVAGVVAWQFLGTSSEPKAVPEGSTLPTSSIEEGPEVVAALEKLPDAPASLVPESMRTEIDPAAALPRGTTVDVNENTWAPDGIGGGVIEIIVTQPGGNVVRYLAVMAKEGEAWKLLATIPVE